MAHFAQISTDGIVREVIVIANPVLHDTNGVEQESIGAQFCADTFGGIWVMTSYNTHGGVHDKGGTPLRKNYAGVGFTYDPVLDAFIPPQPNPTATLNPTTCLWV